jgi:hypothetical protein
LVTYNQIIQRINEAANQHLQIASFGEGDPSQFLEVDSDEAVKYPILWVVDRPHTVQGKSMFFNLTLIFGDRVKKDRSNERDVVSDCIQYATDFIAVLNDLSFVGESNVAYLDKEQNLTITPFTEDRADRISGVQMDIRISQAYEWNRCFVPTSGNTTCT